MRFCKVFKYFMKYQCLLVFFLNTLLCILLCTLVGRTPKGGGGGILHLCAELGYQPVLLYQEYRDVTGQILLISCVYLLGTFL